MIVYGNVIAPDEPEAVPVQLTVPFPEPVIWIDPLLPPHALGLEIVPVAITGAEFTVTAVVADIAEHPFPSVY